MSSPLRFDERTVFAVLSLVGAVLATHISVFHFDFIYDDGPFILYNAFPARLANLGALLSGEALRQGVPDAHHPIAILSAMIDRLLFGLSPDGHHIHSVAVHALNTLLLAWLVHRTFGVPTLAWISGLLFAVMPAHAEAVAIVTERETLLAVTFVLAALLVVQSERWVLAAPLLFLGMLVSELALAAIVLWPVLTWMQQEAGDLRQALRRSARGSGAMAIGALLALVLRCVWAQSVCVGLALREVQDISMRVGGALRTAFIQSTQLVLPIGLGAVHPTTPAPWPLHLEWLMALAVVALFVAAVRRRVDRVLMGATAIVVIGWLPLWTPWWFPDAWLDRFLYLPCVGFSLLIARVMTTWVWPQRGRFVALAGVVAWLVVGHVHAQGLFRNDRVIGARARETTPEVARTWQGLAAVSLRDGRISEARDALSSGLAIVPDDPGLLALSAVAACIEQQPERAKALFERAQSNAPPIHPRLLLQRAGCALRLGDYADAINLARQAAEQAPWMADPHSVRGLALRALGDPRAAETALLESARMAPDRREFWEMLAQLYDERGMADRATWARESGDLPEPGRTDAPRWYEEPR